MDIETIDQQYQQLQTQAQQTVQELSGLADKLQKSAQGGNQDAREWLLDLKSVALAIRAEQSQVGLLLQALHGFVANQAAAPPAAAWSEAPSAPPQGYPPPGYAQPPQGYPPPGYAQPPQGYPPQGYGQAPQGGIGGMLSSFLGSGFGRAIETGAAFGIGDDLIKKIF